MAKRRQRAILFSMQTSYAVKWRESSGHTFLGRLEFGPAALVLEGRDGAADAVCAHDRRSKRWTASVSRSRRAIASTASRHLWSCVPAATFS